MVRITQYSKTCSADVAEIMMNHYRVGSIDEVVTKITGNDRQAFLDAALNKECGNTHRIDEISERGWGVDGTVVHEADTITVKVSGRETIYKEVIFPLPEVVRPGIAMLANFLGCTSVLKDGHIQPIPMADVSVKLFKMSLFKTGQVESYIHDVEGVWNASENVRVDREGQKTAHGLEYVSLVLQFLAGITITQYAQLHTRLVTSVLDLFQYKKEFPTDQWRTSDPQQKVPVAETKSVAFLSPKSPGEWGKVSEQIKAAFNYHPKVLVGPVKLEIPWFVENEKATIEMVRAAVVNSTAVRGGDRSYWSRLMNCTGFSVASEGVNRKRMLTAMAAGVMKTGRAVQIEIDSQDILMVDHSLETLGFSKKMIFYLVKSTTKMSMTRSALFDRLWVVLKPDTVLVQINQSRMPSMKKEDKVGDKLAETMSTLLAIVQHKNYLIYCPIFSPVAFEDARCVITFRPPYDLGAFLTTNAEFVDVKFFPARTIVKDYGAFAKRVVGATSGSVRQIFEPVKIRTGSTEMLNILTHPSKTINVSINAGTGEWSYAEIDASAFLAEGEDDDDNGEFVMPELFGEEKGSVAAIVPPVQADIDNFLLDAADLEGVQ